MQQLCFMSGLTSEQWAAWVQAFGSIGALLVVIGVAAWQGRASRLMMERQMQHAAEERAKNRAEDVAERLQNAWSAVRALRQQCGVMIALLEGMKKINDKAPMRDEFRRVFADSATVVNSAPLQGLSAEQRGRVLHLRQACTLVQILNDADDVMLAMKKIVPLCDEITGALSATQDAGLNLTQK